MKFDIFDALSFSTGLHLSLNLSQAANEAPALGRLGYLFSVGRLTLVIITSIRVIKKKLLVYKFLQVLQCNITRDVLANIEIKRSIATDKHCFFVAKALGVSIDELFRP